MSDDNERGMYRKFKVSRRNDPEGKHDDCRYFVLDIDHDKHARPALEAYAQSCEELFPALAADLRLWLETGEWPL
jgi:hypothetical protein